MTQQFDVAIIGAGLNGLTAAAYLAKAGKNVVVLERGDRVGGAAANRDVFPGFTFPTAGYASSLLHPSIVHDLDLGRHGLVFHPTRAHVTLSQESELLATYPDVQKTVQALQHQSLRDAESYGHMITALRRFATFAEPLLAQTADSGKRNPVNSFELLQEQATAYGDVDTLRTMRWAFQSIGDALEDWFEIPILKAHLAGRALLGASLGPFSATTAPLLSKSLGYFAPGQSATVGYVRGGAGALAEALVKALWSFGGEVRLEAKVSDIQLKDGKAVGVVLDRGEEIEVGTIISSLDVKQTFLTLFDWNALQQPMIDKVLKVKTRGALGKISLALDSQPRFPGIPAGSPLWTGDWQLTPTMLDLERAYDDWKNNVLSQEPHIVFNTPTAFDSTLAPPGKHVMLVFVQYLPEELLDGPWDGEKKEILCQRVIDRISEFSPGFKDLVLHTEVQTPNDLEEMYGLSGGHIFHGEETPDRLLVNSGFQDVAQHRSPISNLYLCGAGCHPAGGLLAMAGQSAARVVQTDLTPRRWL